MPFSQFSVPWWRTRPGAETSFGHSNKTVASARGRTQRPSARRPKQAILSIVDGGQRRRGPLQPTEASRVLLECLGKRYALPLRARLLRCSLHTEETERSVIAKEPQATAAISAPANLPRGSFAESETAAVARLWRTPSQRPSDWSIPVFTVTDLIPPGPLGRCALGPRHTVPAGTSPCTGAGRLPGMHFGSAR